MSYGQIAAFAEVPGTLPEVDESEFKPHRNFATWGRTSHASTSLQNLTAQPNTVSTSKSPVWCMPRFSAPR
ncbi:MAG: hypothetical protein CM1200mP36_05380 [Gammaproteobacteria bacterium]|nr:MAG: hypothetical protein CM1200mP36_05380 [Gammaproteobacteria bacterium]